MRWYPAVHGSIPAGCVLNRHTVTKCTDGTIRCDDCPDEVPVKTPEPPPTQGAGPDIWPLVMADLPENSSMLADMKERHEGGIVKYSMPLRAFNSRNPLVDAYQAALDLVVYLRQALEDARTEKPALVYSLRSKYTQALFSASGLKAMLESEKP